MYDMMHHIIHIMLNSQYSDMFINSQGNTYAVLTIEENQRGPESNLFCFLSL